MIDFRFTGHMSDGVYVDVRFRTDAMTAHDANFNVLQIQEGEGFETADKQGEKYLKYFSGSFKEVNTTFTAMYDFAVANGLNLRSITEKGVVVKEVMEDSASTSV